MTDWWYFSYFAQKIGFDMDEWREIDFNCKKIVCSKESWYPVEVICNEQNIIAYEKKKKILSNI